MTASISYGARGFVVSNLQDRLGGLKKDGDFGSKTRRKVEDTQTALGHAVTGKADREFFEAIGARWPSVFERCLQITDSFEGTGFGGVNLTDIDGAGVTLGIVGYTTKHGEVQRLIRTYVDASPTAISKLPVGPKARLQALCKSSGRNREAWDRWFYGNDGRVDKWIIETVNGWGDDPLFQRIQLEQIENELWLPTLSLANEMGIKSMAGIGLLFDVRVQNGGFAQRHRKHYNAMSQDGSEKSKLNAIATSVTACSRARFRSDVRSRKFIFVAGSGVSHKRLFDLSSYGFEIAD